MKSTRIKDVLGGLLLGLIAALIVVACGSDSNNANSSGPQSQATSERGGSFGSSSGSGSSNTSNSSAGNQTVQGVSQVPVQAQTGPVNPTGRLNEDIRSVIKAARPAVVLIVAENANPSGGDFGGIFGRTQPTERGIGTGSIISPDGFILTNNHVVEGANRFTVTLTGNRGTYPARLIGRESRSNDMAILKIDPKQGESLPTIALGDSSQLEIGEAVIAIGNALGLPGGPTATAGIIGALDRSIQEPDGAQLTQLLQTDAAINPGNSGGPLLNLRGQIIGMNTAAPVDPSQGSVAQGIGFAININQLKPLINGFVQGKPVERPFLGILPQAMSSGLQARYQLPLDYGVLISRVDPNTPAAQAGWKAGEIITKMDGKDLRSLDDLAGVLGAHKAGDRVTATIVARNGQARETQITLGRAP